MAVDQEFKDRARCKLGAPLSNVATTITLETGKGALYALSAPFKFFTAFIVEGNNWELIEGWFDVFPNTGDVINCVRGVGGTTPLAFTAAADIYIAPDKRWFNAVNDFVFAPKNRVAVIMANANIAIANNIETEVSGNGAVTQLSDSAISNSTAPWKFGGFSEGQIVQFSASVKWDANATGIRRAAIQEIIVSNGLDMFGVSEMDCVSATNHSATFVSKKHQVASAAVEYVLKVKQTSGGSLNLLPYATWFQCEILG